MRQISFSQTVEQIRSGQKTVTRRLGWQHARVGDDLTAIVKGQGLRKGEKVERLATIRVVGIRRERLDRMITDPEYGAREVKLEGYPLGYDDPVKFVGWFAEDNGIPWSEEITRIEFEYLA